MKKIFLGLTFIAAIFFTACDPIEDRYEMGGAISADEIEATVTVVQEDGQNVNYVICECSSPITTKWTNGILSKASTYAELKMFATGEQTVTLLGLNPDGTEISKEFTVQIDKISDNYPVEAEYGYFCGDGEKVWVWDEYAPAPFGNGGYMGNIGPGWWLVGMDGLDEQATGMNSEGDGKDASMTFSLNGLTLTKSNGNQGSFDFDMSQMVSPGWDIGAFYTSGTNVLLGVNHNNGDEPYYEYSILKLNDDELWLSAPEPGAGSWGAAWFWCFRAEGTSPE
ncbi:hypothetical protein [uncultured Draconibacterium sp.]|uniref:hypothetical protein n=1 Tax=uncultured Draconibacterium sp. TaxID=1573823 RepID=UPI0025E7B098|nr:hypothetical protein [uncultured Draconibacterium sp.]